jgi:hypothetical protein
MSPGKKTRALIRGNDRAALATAQRDAEAWPYGSLVLCACDHRGAPLLLISDLAEHSRNLAADPRLSLLFDGTAGLTDPLTGARASVLGRAVKDDEPAHLARFVARHPSAGDYFGFADFHLYRIEVERAHLVAGFGAIDWIDRPEILLDTAACRDLATAESDIVDHMNADHADAIAEYAHGLLGRGGDGWRMTGIDPEGADLRRDGEIGRVTFDQPIHGPTEAREQLVALAREARATPRGDLK